MANTKTEIIINELKPKIVALVTKKLSSVKNKTHDVAIAWKKMQDDAAREITRLLHEHLPKSEIIIPASKSTYPDIKIINGEGQFAIDIKVNEDAKNSTPSLKKW